MSLTDHQLIQQCLNGDQTAFGELVYRYQDRLYITISQMLGNSEDGKDVVQEAFIHAYLALHSFKGDSQFFTWLYRIAVNAAISHKRRRKVFLSIDAARNGETKSDPVDTSEAIRPGHQLEQQEQAAQVQNALDRLSPEHRAVLVMKDMEGQKYEEMAQILNVPIGTIRSRLHRARLELREILEQREA